MSVQHVLICATWTEPYDSGFIFMIFEANPLSPTPDNVTVIPSKPTPDECIIAADTDPSVVV